MPRLRDLSTRLKALWRREKALSSRPVFDTQQQIMRADVSPAVLAKGLLRAAVGRFTRSRRTVYEVKRLHPPLADRPRIVHFIPNVFIGGSTQLLVDLHDHLGHAYDMSVITAALPRRGRHVGMDIHVHPLPGSREAMTEALRRLAPDLVHVHYWGSTDDCWYEAAFAAAEAVGVGVVQNINTPVPRFASKSIVQDIFVSHSAQGVGGTAAHVPAAVVYPAIDLRRFSARPFAPHAEDSIGMVYRLERDKLDDTSIRPFIEVATLRPRTRCFIIGDGSLFDSFVRQVNEAGVGANFVFTGTVPYGDLPEWYRQFRVFVAPVHQESFGQVTPFAMAMGLAVAGSHEGALPEILESDATLGRNLSETVRCILDLLDDPDRLETLGARNREIALRRFDVDVMAEAYGAIYAARLPRRPPDP